MPRFSLDDFVSFRDDDDEDSSDSDDEEKEEVLSLSYTTDTFSSDSSSDSSDEEEEEERHPLGFGTTRLGLFNADSYTYNGIYVKPKNNYYDDDDDDGETDTDDLGAFFSPSFVPKMKKSQVVRGSNARETGVLLKHHYRTKTATTDYIYDHDDEMKGMLDGMDKIAYLVRVAKVVDESRSPVHINPPAAISTSTPSTKLQSLLRAAEEERMIQQTIQRKIEAERREILQKQKRDADLLLSLILRDQAAAGKILREEQRVEEARLEQIRVEQEEKDEENRRKRKEEERIIQLKQEKKEAELKKLQEQDAKEKEQQAIVQKHKEDREKAKAEKMKYVTTAKTMVSKLSTVRQQLEYFETSKEKHISKRRLQMKKIARGKMNTLSHDRVKVEQVTTTILQSIQANTNDDIQLRQQMESGNSGITKDMTRGARYLMDLIASTTIVRVQAEGFNG